MPLPTLAHYACSLSPRFTSSAFSAGIARSTVNPFQSPPIICRGPVFRPELSTRTRKYGNVCGNAIGGSTRRLGFVRDTLSGCFTSNSARAQGLCRIRWIGRQRRPEGNYIIDLLSTRTAASAGSARYTSFKISLDCASVGSVQAANSSSLVRPSPSGSKALSFAPGSSARRTVAYFNSHQSGSLSFSDSSLYPGSRMSNSRAFRASGKKREISASRSVSTPSTASST